MSRPAWVDGGVEGRTASALERIADALEIIAARTTPQTFVVQLPAEFTAGEAREVLDQLRKAMGVDD